MIDKRLFHYSVLRVYNSHLFETLLYDHHIVSDTMIEMEVSGGLAQGYFAKKNRQLYMIDKETLNKLPIRIKKTREELDGKKVFNLVTEANSFKITPENNMSFKELINTIADFNHSNKDNWTLYKIICIASYCSRTFTRISTNPGFGKDSIKGVLHNLTSKVNVIKPRTIPGVLKELTSDGEIVLNESSGMKKEIRDLVQDIILQLGDGTVSYANGALRSSSHKTKDKYDVHRLSVTAMFNRLQDYKSEDEFFDYQFENNNAIKDRLLPIKLSGLITEGFKNDYDYTQLMKDNTTVLANIIKNIEYWKINHLAMMKPYSKPAYPQKGRHKQTIDVLFSFINLYSETQEEYIKWCNLLLQRIQDYYDMIGKQTNELPEIKINLEDSMDSDVEVMTIKEDIKTIKIEDLDVDKEYSIIELYSEGLDDKMIDNYLEDGDIFELRPGIYRVMD